MGEEGEGFEGRWRTWGKREGEVVERGERGEAKLTAHIFQGSIDVICSLWILSPGTRA